MRRRRVLGALGVAGVAGCLRLEDDGTASSTDSARTTGAGTTGRREASATRPGDASTTETVEDVDSVASYPLGMTAEGATSGLAETHASRLWEAPFSVTWRYANPSSGDVLVAHETRVADGVARRTATANQETEFAIAEDGTYWRQPVDDGATYGRERDLWDRAQLTYSTRLATLLGIGAWTTVERADDDGPAFAVRADGVDTAFDGRYGSGRLSGRDVEAFSGTARVRESGLVTALDASWTAKQPGSDDFQRLRASFRVTDYGDTTVSLPSWFETARERAPSVSGRVVDDGTAIALAHEGGNPFVAGSNALLYDPDAGRPAGWGARLDEPLVEGETAYVYHRDGMQLGVTRGSPPDPSTVSDPIGGRRRFWYGYGPARYFPGVDVAP